ncbi:MAG: hypothetical protein AAGI91_12480 [Bacteroidota bacterium]
MSGSYFAARTAKRVCSGGTGLSQIVNGAQRQFDYVRQVQEQG